ncbi:MAG: carboxypeptidase regulatory-like domain-containing protein [Thermoplasmata archaeon]|nr:MAG: carboxypeptidase regulatory-like domain-containing protein [Thermoplasmata archaeon]
MAILHVDNGSAVKPDDSVDGVQYLEGTWNIINAPEEYTDETIIITGNISIYKLLDLKNTTIKINSSATNMFILNTYTSNGNLSLTNNSAIIANNTQYPYDMIFNTGSIAYIANSLISDVGKAGSLSEGILIKTPSVIFDNVRITNNYNGIVCSSTSPKILNSKIENSVNKDILLKGDSHPYVLNTEVNKSKVEVTGTSSLTLNWYLSLTVKNQSNGEPLPDVDVTIKNATGITSGNFKTDANGQILNLILPECDIHPDRIVNHTPYSIELDKENFNKLTVSPVNLTASSSVEISMTLKPQEGIIAGNVTDEDGNPLENMIITVTAEDFESIVYSNSTGQYNVTEIPEGTEYTISAANQDNYVLHTIKDVEVTGNNVTNIDFELAWPLSITPINGAVDVPVDTSITIIFEDEMNASSVETYFELRSNSTSVKVAGEMVSTDSEIFTFTPTNLLDHAEDYSIKISRYVKNKTEKKILWDDFKSYFTTVYSSPTVDITQPVGTNVPLDAEVIIAFDQEMNKSSVEDAITVLPPVQITSFEWSSLSGVDDATTIKVHFTKTGGTQYTITVGMTAKSIHGIPLDAPNSFQFTTLIEFGTITGEIIDENGTPVQGVRVEIKGTSLFAMTGSDGRFTLGNIPEGQNYYLVFSKAGFETQEKGPISVSPGQTVPLSDRVVLEKPPVEKEAEDDDDDEIENAGLVALLIFLVIIILILIVLMATTSKPQPAPQEREERVDYLELGAEPYMEEGEGEEGEEEEEEEPAVPAPPYRGRCPVCRHVVYGDAGCFHCASSMGGGGYYPEEEGQ